VQHEIGSCGQLPWTLVGGHGDADEVVEAARGEAREGIEVGHVVSRVKGAPGRRLAQELPHGGALVGLDRRADLEHLAPPARDESFGSCPRGDVFELGAGLRLVAGLAEVVRKGQPLVLYLSADRVAEGRDSAAEIVGVREQLEPVVPHVADAGHAHDTLGVRARAAAHAGDEEIPGHEPAKLGAGPFGNCRELRTGDDRRERAVHVEDDRALLRSLAERREELGRHADQNTGVPSALPFRAVYGGIGLAAGFFSALFGVGGGIVVVPLLVLLAGFGAAEAAATSLATVGITALFGMAAFGALGEVSWADAVVVGLPAVAGVVAGTALQQRVSSRLLGGLLAAVLVAIAFRLLLE
jgi:hypothetical protein